MDSQWDRDETLGDLFVTRKCFSYGRDSAGRALDGREARGAMDQALERVEATYQNIDTFEIGITDVDHYFEYLGGISKAVEKRSRSHLRSICQIRFLVPRRLGHWKKLSAWRRERKR